MRDEDTVKMDIFEGINLVKKVSRLEKRVTKESYGSWMVVEWLKGRGRALKGGFDGGAGDLAGGLRFSMLNMKNGDLGGENQWMSNEEYLNSGADMVSNGNSASLGFSSKGKYLKLKGKKI